MTKQILPEGLRQKLVKAGKARAAQLTHAQRVEQGKKAWATRLARAQQAESVKPQEN